MKKAIITSILVVILTFVIKQNSQAQDLGKKHKVVVQFVSSDTLAQHSLLNNLKSIKEGWPLSQVEVVFHGNGLNMIITEKTKFSKELQDLVENKGIKIVGCENTMRNRKVTKDQLLPFAGTVPMGVGEIIMKQEKGWSYLRAGL